MGGVVCNNTVEVRRIAFHSLNPMVTDPIYVLKYDDELANSYTPDDYAKSGLYGQTFWKQALNPSNAWTMPFVTGHKYKFHWGYNKKVNYLGFQMQLNGRWSSTD